MRSLRKRVSGKHYHAGGDGTMKQKKKWYDFLWIVSLSYLILGFFNILFAWLGLLCFFIPLIIAIAGGNKAYCNKFCGRGQLFSLIGGRFGLSRKKDIPKWLKSAWFRYGFLIFFFVMFFMMLWNTYLVFAGTKDLNTAVTLLWTFRLPCAGRTMELCFPTASRSLHSAFTALCSLPPCLDFSPWFYASPVPGAYTVPWEQ